MASRFGTPVKDDNYEGGGGGEVYLKKVCAKAPLQRLRILQPVETFIKWFEHYEEGPGAFFCMNSGVHKIEDIYKDPHECPECVEIKAASRDLADFTVKLKDKRKILYAANALEQNGRLSVFKFGSTVKKNLQTKEQLRGTIMDRDVTIMKSGTGLGTEYNVESEEAYEIDWPKEIYNIQGALAYQWIEAMASYDFPISEEMRAEAEQKMVPGFRPIRTGPQVVEHIVIGTELEVPAGETPGDEAQAMSPAQQVTENPTPNDYTEWDVTTIKKFLETRQVEYPDRAARSRLLSFVTKYVGEHPDDDMSIPPF